MFEIRENILHFDWEEIANAATHGIGFLLSLFGFGWLLAVAVITQDPLRISCASIFGSCMILLYAASTLYHSFRKPNIKHRLRIFDHCAIYLMIAGSYSPFLLISHGGENAQLMFIAVWTMAALGIIFKLFFIHKWPHASTFFYLVMGWLLVFDFQPIVDALEPAGIALLILGGLSYTLGAVVYSIERPRFHHAIWHLFVMGGSACHYLAILLYVIAIP